MKTNSRDKCSICIPFERSTYDKIIFVSWNSKNEGYRLIPVK